MPPLFLLQAFKLRFLSEHSDRLVRLADNKSLREEMTTFPLARGMDGGVRDEDRAGLLPLLVRQGGERLRGVGAKGDGTRRWHKEGWGGDVKHSLLHRSNITLLLHVGFICVIMFGVVGTPFSSALHCLPSSPPPLPTLPGAPSLPEAAQTERTAGRPRCPRECTGCSAQLPGQPGPN